MQRRQQVISPAFCFNGVETMSLLDSLTKRQRLVFDFIRDKIQNRGYGPTVREIGEHFDIKSPNGVM